MNIKFACYFGTGLEDAVGLDVKYLILNLNTNRVIKFGDMNYLDMGIYYTDVESSIFNENDYYFVKCWVSNTDSQIAKRLPYLQVYKDFSYREFNIYNTLMFLKNVEGGRWKIDKATNEMIFYAEDNTTELMRFDLKDENGNPNSVNVFERVRKQ